MQPVQERLREHLTQDGWKCYQEDEERWYKRFPNSHQCSSTRAWPGVQVSVTLHEIKHTYAGKTETHYSFSIGIRACKADGVWADLRCYGIGDEILQVLNSQVQQLLIAWESVNLHK